jgi:hypothetical protein
MNLPTRGHAVVTSHGTQLAHRSHQGRGSDERHAGVDEEPLVRIVP